MSIEQKKKITAMLMADSLRQIQKRCQMILEKMSRDGIESCSSANLDLLDDAKNAWTCAATMHLLVHQPGIYDEEKKDEP
jgi:hypothetical protein